MYRENMMENQRIHEWFLAHKEEMVYDIQRLVSIKSVSSKNEAVPPYGAGCRAVLDEMLKLGSSYGFSTENNAYHYGKIRWGTGEKSLGVWNHLDVVEEGGGWGFPPYKGVLHKGFMIGRGVQDNKGPAIAVLYALRCIKELKLPLNIQVEQLLGCNEEQGMEDIDVFLKAEKIPDFSFVADCSFPVCNGEKGICELELFSEEKITEVLELCGGESSNSIPSKARAVLSSREEIETRGRSGHVAFPGEMVNALGELFTLLGQKDYMGYHQKTLDFLGRVGRESSGETLGIAWKDETFGALTCVMTKGDIRQGRLHVFLNIRYPHSWNYQEMLGKIRDKVMKYGLSLKEIRNSPSYLEENENIDKLLQAYEAIMEEKGYTYTMGGGTYARKLPNTVAFGPGLPADLSAINFPEGHGDCHGPDEAQSIDRLITAGRIYVDSILRLNTSWS